MLSDILQDDPDPVLSLDEVKLHLRIDSDEEDDLLEALIKATTEKAEEYLSRSIQIQDRKCKFDGFPKGRPCALGVLVLPRPITVDPIVIRYLDTTGTQQTLDAAKIYVDHDSEPARVVPAIGELWPDTAPYPSSVEVEYTSGYEIIPECIRRAMLLIIGHFYANKEDTISGTIIAYIPQNAEWLMHPERVERFV